MDYFELVPDEAAPLVFKFSSLVGKEVRFTSVASHFRNRELMHSKAVAMCWRVSYSHDDQAGMGEKDKWKIRERFGQLLGFKAQCQCKF